MAGAIAVSGTLQTTANVTLSVTGLSATTAYSMAINDAGGTNTVPLTTDGSGNFSWTYVPSAVGSVTVTITEVPTTQATATFIVGDNT